MDFKFGIVTAFFFFNVTIWTTSIRARMCLNHADRHFPITTARIYADCENGCENGCENARMDSDCEIGRYGLRDWMREWTAQTARLDARMDADCENECGNCENGCPGFECALVKRE